MIEIKKTSTQDCELIETIARPIWQQHYIPIIGEAQVEYMLSKFQNSTAILEQMNNGMDYYLVYFGENCAGYFSVQDKDDHLFISKFYLDVQYRGQGIGRLMLEKIVDLAQQKQLDQLQLTVNKYNPAYQAYLKLGFTNTASIQVDIGEGYIMDDFVMCKELINQ